jgi:hypothetical protein
MEYRRGEMVHLCLRRELFFLLIIGIYWFSVALLCNSINLRMQRLFAKKDVAKIIHESLHRKTGIICTVDRILDGRLE